MAVKRVRANDVSSDSRPIQLNVLRLRSKSTLAVFARRTESGVPDGNLGFALGFLPRGKKNQRGNKKRKSHGPDRQTYHMSLTSEVSGRHVRE